MYVDMLTLLGHIELEVTLRTNYLVYILTCWRRFGYLVQH